MLDTAAVDGLAAELARAHRQRLAYSRIDAARQGAGVDDAYRVQARLQALQQAEDGVGDIVGWKIALTSRAMQALVHVDEPLAGCVFASRVQHAPGTVSLARHQHVGVEFEVVVWLGSDLGPRPGGHDRHSVAAAVQACAAAYELVEDRHADYGDLDAFNLVADNCWNAGVVLGVPNPSWHGVDLANAPTRALVDGVPIGAGRAGDALGHPLEALAWLANLFSRQGRTLPAGSLVMTGSSIRTHFPAPGQRLHFEVEGLGAAELRFVA